MRNVFTISANNENLNCLCDTTKCLPDTEHNQSPKSTVLNEVPRGHLEIPIQSKLNFIMQL